jgi:hypothetical protein
MADCKKYNGSTWQHSLRKLGTATDTITTLPAVIYPNDTSITVGIKGNTVQNGSPTPDNPITPQGCGERTENWFDYKTAYASYLSGDDVVITPTQMTSEKQYFKASEVGKTITISVFAKTVTSNRVLIRARIGGTNINSNTVSRGNSGTLTVTVTPTSTSDFFNLTYGDGGDYNTFNKIMVNEGSTALPYEPYGYKIPISSANTTTPIYLGEVETTRRVKKLVLTGDEQWMKSGAYQGSFYAQTVTDILSETYTAFCSHLTFSSLSQYAKGKFCFNGGITKNCNLWFNQFDSSTTVADFKAYLQQQYANGTPVTVWYVLATPQTAIVNEPLMKIGDYADSLTTSIPCTAGENTLDVQTTVAPSEVTATFEGWHPAIVHERTNGAWT